MKLSIKLLTYSGLQSKGIFGRAVKVLRLKDGSDMAPTFIPHPYPRVCFWTLTCLQTNFKQLCKTITMRRTCISGPFDCIPTSGHTDGGIPLLICLTCCQKNIEAIPNMQQEEIQVGKTLGLG
jgi:hypothetical protein